MDFTVLLVESNEIMLKGLSCALARHRGIRRITEVIDATRAIAAAERERFDVAVLGTGIGEEAQHGLVTGLRSIWPDTRCIMIVRGGSERELEKAMRSQASGVLLGNNSAEELWLAIELVRQGGRYWSRALEEGIVDRLRSGSSSNPGSFSSLTEREREILQLVGEGESNAEIAAALGLSRRTVDTHRTRLMRKLHIHKTAALVRFAVREGVVEA